MWIPSKFRKLANALRRTLYPLGNAPRPCPVEFDGSFEATQNLFFRLTGDLHRKCWDWRRGYFKIGRSLQRGPGGARADTLELAARSFIGVAYFCLRDDCPDWRDRYLETIKKGTDPNSKYYWGRIESTAMLVENASLIVGLLLEPKNFWERLTSQERKNFISYIAECSQKSFYESNWLWFKVLHLLFLEEAAGIPQEKEICGLLDTLGSFYDGEGWYNDGRKEQERRYDHYNAWAMHYYGLLFCRLADHRYADCKEELKRRAREFYKTYDYFFSASGLPLFWGRSLIYRFGMLGFFALYIAEGLASLEELQTIKQKVVSTLRKFLAEDILDADGLLNLGCFAPSAALLEPYSGDGSPYWAFKFFAFFLLPSEHPYWRALPRSSNDQDMKVIRSLGVTSVSDGDRHRFFLNGGLNSRLYTWKYGKFAYSNVFFQTVDPKYADNSFTFRSQGRFVSRDTLHDFSAGPGGSWRGRWGVSPIKGLEARSTLIPLPDGYVLVCEMECDARVEYLFCGFKIPGKAVSRGSSEKKLRLSSGSFISSLGIFHKDDGRYFCRTVDRRRAMDSRKSSLPVYRSFLKPGVTTLLFCVQASDHGNVTPVDLELRDDLLIFRERTLERVLKKNGSYYV